MDLLEFRKRQIYIRMSISIDANICRVLHKIVNIICTGYLQILSRFGFFFVHDVLTRAF